MNIMDDANTPPFAYHPRRDSPLRGYSRPTCADQPYCRHPRESRDPVAFATHRVQSRWVPDIASRLCLQDC